MIGWAAYKRGRIRVREGGADSRGDAPFGARPTPPPPYSTGGAPERADYANVGER